VWYCSVDCQRADWASHKTTCKRGGTATVAAAAGAGGGAAAAAEAMPHVTGRPAEAGGGLRLPEVQEAMRASAGVVDELKRTSECAARLPFPLA
jgi:MYND finger